MYRVPEVRLGEEYRYDTRTTSRGVQTKYHKDQYFYKVDASGNEGFVEYLVSRFLAYSSLQENEYVSYEPFRINGKPGCRSWNFLREGEEFVTMNTVYERETGFHRLQDKLWGFRNAKDRLEYILDLAGRIGMDRQQYADAMKKMLQLDLLIANTDRHPHNYGVIYDSRQDRFTPAPIFDNGRSLETVPGEDVAACTLSGSFEEQLVAFGFPVKPAFSVDAAGFLSELSEMEKDWGKRREMECFRERIRTYQYLLE